jgi:hypothetical protein
MAGTVTFLAPSGSPASGLVISSLVPGAVSGANRIGFFNTGGPQGVPFAILLNTYQKRTFVTNANGENLGLAPYGVVASGRLINHRFVNSASVTVQEQDTVALTDVPEVSGMLLIRFEPDTGTVAAQNTLVRVVNLNSSSGVVDITGLVTGINFQGYEVSKDAAWTAIGGSLASDNRLFLLDRDVEDSVHDFHIGISASPETIGLRTDWGITFQVEFL